MCLVNPTTDKPKVADKDIVCIKQLHNDITLPCPVTPYRRAYVNNAILEADQLGVSLCDVSDQMLVDHGIHTYHPNALWLDKKEIETLRKNHWLAYRIGIYRYTKIVFFAECIIPKGTKYYTNNNEYCSEKIEILAYEDIKKMCKECMQAYLNKKKYVFD